MSEPRMPRPSIGLGLALAALVCLGVILWFMAG
jgi:hypothetical protein